MTYRADSDSLLITTSLLDEFWTKALASKRKKIGLCKDMGLRRHVCIVFWPNPPIAILELPNCLS